MKRKKKNTKKKERIYICIYTIPSIGTEERIRELEVGG